MGWVDCFYYEHVNWEEEINALVKATRRYYCLLLATCRIAGKGRCQYQAVYHVRAGKYQKTTSTSTLRASKPHELRGRKGRSSAGLKFSGDISISDGTNTNRLWFVVFGTITVDYSSGYGQ